ncbi:MAG: PEGA domain-containing protein, partial [Nanoarchaeota archaeon]|nr:PEGA domain-containing protein [Nanoarchaeota archaeon]
MKKRFRTGLLCMIVLILLLSGCEGIITGDAAAPSGKGTLAINARVNGKMMPGLEVYVDGTYRGVTPLTLTNVAAGSHNVKIQKLPQYLPAATTTRVAAKRTANVNLFVPIAQGIIAVTSTPSGAVVVIDEVVRGKTPYRARSNVGSHIITIRKNGFESHRETIILTTSAPTSITVQLQPSLPPLPPAAKYAVPPGLLPGNRTNKTNETKVPPVPPLPPPIPPLPPMGRLPNLTNQT